MSEKIHAAYRRSTATTRALLDHFGMAAIIYAVIIGAGFAANNVLSLTFTRTMASF